MPPKPIKPNRKSRKRWQGAGVKYLVPEVLPAEEFDCRVLPGPPQPSKNLSAYVFDPKAIQGHLAAEQKGLPPQRNHKGGRPARSNGRRPRQRGPNKT